MKKLTSLFLSLIMMFSCFSVLTVNAADETTESGGGIGDMLYNEETIAASKSALESFVVNNLPGSIGEFNEFKNSADWNKIDLLGITPEFLYSGTGKLVWGQLDVFYKDANGNVILDKNGNSTLKISKDDISSAMLNINIYLQKYLYNKYGGLNLYTVKNAIALSNAIGKMLDYDFTELNPANFSKIFGNETPSTNEFFLKVAELSGLGKIVEANWITRGRNFCEPLVKVLGGDYVTFYSEYYNVGNGMKLASKIIEGVVQKTLTVGPIDVIMDLLDVFASPAYNYTYREPTLALFAYKKAAFSNSGVSEDELNSFNGLLKLIFCDCDPIEKDGCFGGENASHFAPYVFPVDRYNSAEDVEECYIYLYYYLNLCSRYRGNGIYFRSIQEKIKNDNSISADDKTKLVAIIDGFFLGNFTNTIENAIIPLYKENINTASTSIFDRVRNALMGFLKKIADYFDYLRKLFSGELNYGGGNSPFN